MHNVLLLLRMPLEVTPMGTSLGYVPLTTCTSKVHPHHSAVCVVDEDDREEEEDGVTDDDNDHREKVQEML